MLMSTGLPSRVAEGAKKHHVNMWALYHDTERWDTVALAICRYNRWVKNRL